MIRNFFSTPNLLGRLLIVMIFAGGVIFAGAFNGFVIETEASSCCGGGMDDAIFLSSSCGTCSCLTGTSCGSSCDNGKCSGSKTNTCPGSSDCSPSKTGCTCDGKVCPNASNCCSAVCG